VGSHIIAIGLGTAAAISVVSGGVELIQSAARGEHVTAWQAVKAMLIEPAISVATAYATLGIGGALAPLLGKVAGYTLAGIVSAMAGSVASATVEGGVRSRRVWAQVGINMAIAAGEALLLAGVGAAAGRSPSGGTSGSAAPPEPAAQPEPAALAAAAPEPTAPPAAAPLPAAAPEAHQIVDVRAESIAYLRRQPYTQYEHVPMMMEQRIVKEYPERFIGASPNTEVYRRTVVTLANRHYATAVRHDLNAALGIDVWSDVYESVVNNYPVTVEEIVRQHAGNRPRLREMIRELGYR
jgi:hypothetical protein